MIKCRECEVAKEPSEFHRCRILSFVKKRQRPSCKACQNLSNRGWYAKNSDHRRKAIDKYRKENPDKVKAFQTIYKIKNRKELRERRAKQHRSYENYKSYLYTSIQQRIKHIDSYKNRICTFTKEDFLDWLENSAYKIYFEMWELTGFLRKFSPTIDRINDDGDYTLQNIQILPQAVNTHKYMKTERGQKHIAKTREFLAKKRQEEKSREVVIN